VIDRRLPIVLSGLTAIRVGASLLTFVLAARRFGVGLEMDLFFLAVTPLIAVVNMTEAAGIGAAINFYARLLPQTADERDRAVAGLFLHLGGLFLLAALLFLVLAGPIASGLGAGLDPGARVRLATMLRWSAVGIAFAPLGLVAGVGLLRARSHFLTAAALPFFPSLFQVLALLTFADTAEKFVAALVVGHVVAAVLGLTLSARRLRPAWSHPDRRATLAYLREALPLATGELALQGLYIRERQLAAMLPPGSLSALALGQRLVGVAGAIVATGVEHTALPAIATAQFGGAPDEARRQARDAIIVAGVLALAAGIVVFLAPELWVRLAFRRGAFGEWDTLLTASAASAYVGLFVYNALGRVGIAASFGRGLGWRIAGTQGLLLLTYLLISAPMARAAGFDGLAWAASISFALGTVLAMSTHFRTRT
jgi:putative peptidoglycan lipid II flippase